MILNGLPARFKLLPIVILALVLLFSYFYLLDGNSLDQPLWGQATVSHGVDKATEMVSAAGTKLHDGVDKAKEIAGVGPAIPPSAPSGQDSTAPMPPTFDDSKASSDSKSSNANTYGDSKASDSKVSDATAFSSSKASDSKVSDGKTTGGSTGSDSKSSGSKSSGSKSSDSKAYTGLKKPDDEFNYPASPPASAADYIPKSGSGVKKGSVVMVTASTGTGGFLGIPQLKEMVYENRMSYAQRHGYDMMWANITSYNLPDDAPIYWNKIPVLQEAFVRYPQAEWLWWMDMDIIIMNHSLSMWDHVLSPKGMERNAVLDEVLKKPGGGDSGWRTPASYDYDEVNFMISSGGWGMNVGNFLLRRSEWADWLLDLWIEPMYIERGWTFPENDGWTHMYRHHPIVRKHTVCTNQRALNAYPSYNSLGEHWQQGDHTIHFAGCGNNTKCPDHWDKYWALRESYTVPTSIQEQLADGSAKIENVQKGEGLPRSFTSFD